ncbi:MAG: hypothetical protein MHM6MM_001075 [Cercozoa sp. M6MM]
MLRNLSLLRRGRRLFSADVLKELQWRGAVHQTTGDDTVRELLQQPTAFYAGFDPTAPSLHVGNLLVMITMLRLAKGGLNPVALLGGATGMIGDPSFRDTERVLMSDDQVVHNKRRIESQIRAFFQRNGTEVQVVDNLEWYSDMTSLEWLRDIAMHMRVPTMLARDSVAARMRAESGARLSLGELCYQALQAHDFVRLYKTREVQLQLGGSDQWGNIIAGIDLARRNGESEEEDKLHGLTVPLLTTSSGEKFGKSAGNAIFLDSSPFAIYQYFRSQPDADIPRLLRLFTFLDQERIEELETELAENAETGQVQSLLAAEVTRLVCGDEGVEAAQAGTAALFGRGKLSALDAPTLRDVLRGVTSTTVSKDKLEQGELSLSEALVSAGLAPSKKQANKAIANGSIYLNDDRVSEATLRLSSEHLLADTCVVLRSGKKRRAVLHVE